MTTIQRTAVLTGATSDRGIGITTARRYASQGWAVVILDLDGEKSAKVAAEIGNEFNVPAFGHEIDVANEDSVNAAYKAVAAEVASGTLPAVGALANIAGITSPVPFLETTLDLWNKVMAVNSTGTYLVTKAFLPDMIASGWGRIVNMSSVSAQRGGGVFGKVPYSAAKAAILGFTKALAREIGATGVTVNAITPGAVDTNIRVGSTEEQEAAINAGIPVGPQRQHRGNRGRHHLPVLRGIRLPHRHHHRHQRRKPHPLAVPVAQDGPHPAGVPQPAGARHGARLLHADLDPLHHVVAHALVVPHRFQRLDGAAGIRGAAGELVLARVGHPRHRPRAPRERRLPGAPAGPAAHLPSIPTSTRCTAPCPDHARPVSITGPGGRIRLRVKKSGTPGGTISERTLIHVTGVPASSASCW